MRWSYLVGALSVTACLAQHSYFPLHPDLGFHAYGWWPSTCPVVAMLIADGMCGGPWHMRLFNSLNQTTVNSSECPSATATLTQKWDDVPVDVTHLAFWLPTAAAVHLGGAKQFSFVADLKRRFPALRRTLLFDSHDEMLGYNLEFYNMVDAVVRTYQLPEVHSQMSVVMHPERVHTMLLGGSEKCEITSSDVIVPSSQRSVAFFFAGHPIGERLEMWESIEPQLESGGLEEYLEARNMTYFVSFTGGHRRNIFKTLDEYKAMLLNSVFSLCPGGNNAESHRLYEVLDAGSIPLVTRNDWERGLQHIGASPLRILDSWDELGSLIRGYVSEPRRLDEYQRQLAAWWKQRQEQANDLFRSALMGAPIATRCQYDSCSETLKDTPSVNARTAARRLWLVHPRDGQLVPHLGALIVRIVSEGVDASGIEVHIDSGSVDRSAVLAVGAQYTAAGTP